MKRIASVLISAAILFAIYSQIQLNQIVSIFQGSSELVLALSLLMVAPLTLLTGVRLSWLMPKQALGAREATRLTLMASVLNLLLPSKLGDIIKSYAVAERCKTSLTFALALVVFEKGWDMAALLVWCLAASVTAANAMMTALIFLTTSLLVLFLCSTYVAQTFSMLLITVSPSRIADAIGRVSGPWKEILDYFWGDRSKALRVIALSLFLWFLHLFQIWLFILAIGAWVPLGTTLLLAPIAILAGLMPLTFAGIGTRDAALIFLFQSHLSPQEAAAVGVLCSARYFLPALAGLPLLSEYIAHRRLHRRNRSGMKDRP